MQTKWIPKQKYKNLDYALNSCNLNWRKEAFLFAFEVLSLIIKKLWIFTWSSTVVLSRSDAVTCRWSSSRVLFLRQLITIVQTSL